MIYLIGAGPGDSGLLTLRGHEILMRADVVIYDRLVGEGILAMIPDTAEKIDAGKFAGSHKISQSEIENLIIAKARSHKNIVRLKGGDPFLFGRGGEEAEAIIKAGLDFEIVPGVSSALAVPAWAGIPATHRKFSSGVEIFTAHDKNNLIPDFKNSTKIFLMGVSNAEDLEKKLLSKFPPSTPCSIISNGTTARQQVIKTQLGWLHEAAKKINPPAVILIGGVAGLNLNWRNSLPLNSQRILITRPAGRSEKLAAMLRDAGAEVIVMPTIRTSLIKNSLDNKNLSKYDFIAFTSVTGVESFFDLLRDSERDIREIGNAKIAAIGQATADSLRTHGLKVDFVPDIYNLENLADGLAKFGGRVLILRALDGPKLSKNFEEICIYKTDFIKLNHVPKDLDIIIFTSSSTVRGFMASVASIDDIRGVKAVCIGAQTANETLRAGFNSINIKIAKQATMEEIFNSCLMLAKN